jgi:hypothetical protein
MVEHTRTLDFKIAYAIGLGTMIAAGIFSLSGTAVAEIGSSAVIAFVLAAVVAGLTAASYSEFASIYAENGGILIIGATRTRRLRRRVFGSTPDNVIKLARGGGVPVLVYSSPRGVQGPIEEYVYPVYRYLRGIRRSPTQAGESGAEE